MAHAQIPHVAPVVTATNNTFTVTIAGTSSVIALSRQKVPYINPKNTNKNICENGAYTVNITSHESNVTLVHVEMHIEVSGKRKKHVAQIRHPNFV